MVFKLKPYQEAMVEKIIENKRLGLSLVLGTKKKKIDTLKKKLI